jgi:hypothetical protein
MYEHVRNDLAVASRIYVPNLAGQLHRAATPEARCAQRLPDTDLDAFQSMHLIDVHLTGVYLLSVHLLQMCILESFNLPTLLPPIAESACGRNSRANLSVTSYFDNLRRILVRKGGYIPM